MSDLDRLRACFPGLDRSTALLENAGGSQVPDVVTQAVADHMRHRYVQLGAGYPLSREADEAVAAAHEFSQTFVGDDGPTEQRRGVCVLGPSTSQLCAMLASEYGKTLEAGDNVIVVQTGHEANVGPWTKLADQGIEVRIWPVDPRTLRCEIDDLLPLLDSRTRVVAVVHVSNLLGEVVDLAAVTRRAHQFDAHVIVDGVAYAPHRTVDVLAADVDAYVFSTYKVYGPHMAVLWARRALLDSFPGPNHFFIPHDELPYRFELGGVSHEAAAGWAALPEYLRVVADAGADAPADRALVTRAFERMAELERPLIDRLVGFLADDERFTVVGPTTDDRDRVATVSFLHRDRSSADVVAALHAADIAVRNGHMYARRLCEPLGLDPTDGVVRVSAVHYNAPDEIDRVLAVLREL